MRGSTVGQGITKKLVFRGGRALEWLRRMAVPGVSLARGGDQMGMMDGILGGLAPQDLAQKLSHVLPQAIDKLTPGGVVPKA